MERIQETEFDDRGLRRPGVWAVVFLADWCPFCREFRPVFAAFAPRWPGPAAEADVSDFASPLWDRFGIEVVPTVIVFRDGVPIGRADGRSGEGLETDDLVRLRARILGAPAAGTTGPPGTPIS